MPLQILPALLARRALAGAVMTLVMALVMITGAAMAADPSARRTVTVDAEGVYLSDLFNGVAPADDRWIGQAPVPGETVTYKANMLAAIARGNALNWRPRSSREQVRVSRPGRRVPLALIKDRLATRLRDQAGGGGIDIDLFAAPQVFIDPSLPADVTVEDLSTTPGGRFNARLAVPTLSGTSRLIDISGRAHATRKMPVPARHLRRGETITANDVTWRQVRSRAGDHVMVSDPDSIIGFTPRRTLIAGKPIRRTDVTPRMVIRKGDQIQVSLSTGSMTLTTRGVALQAGAIGETIRIRNVNSRKIIEATVTNAGDAVIRPISLHAARS
ncbi:MAG: flagellar basal body P-ring formation chaperone FlgA [Thalassobaculaceae bacterium]